MRILVAYNGSECAKLMLRSLRCAGLPQRVEAIVMTVYEHPHDRHGLGDNNSTRCAAGYDAACALAKGASSQLAAYFPFWTIGEIVTVGSPAKQLVKYARALRVDLITLGCTGHSAVDRILRRSISQGVMNGAHCSVRVCRTLVAKPDAKPHLLIGYDGLPAAMAAVRTVAARTWPQGTLVTLLTTVGFGYCPAANLTIPEDYNRVWQLQFPAFEVLLEAGFDVFAVAIEDDPKLAILEQAKATRASCVFIGCNERSLAYQLFIGRVASAVVPRVACSVEVVRS